MEHVHLALQTVYYATPQPTAMHAEVDIASQLLVALKYADLTISADIDCLND